MAIVRSVTVEFNRSVLNYLCLVKITLQLNQWRQEAGRRGGPPRVTV